LSGKDGKLEDGTFASTIETVTGFLSVVLVDASTLLGLGIERTPNTTTNWDTSVLRVDISGDGVDRRSNTSLARERRLGSRWARESVVRVRDGGDGAATVTVETETDFLGRTGSDTVAGTSGCVPATVDTSKVRLNVTNNRGTVSRGGTLFLAVGALELGASPFLYDCAATVIVQTETNFLVVIGTDTGAALGVSIPTSETTTVGGTFVAAWWARRRRKGFTRVTGNGILGANKFTAVPHLENSASALSIKTVTR